MGTVTGLGDVNGAGTAVTLIDISQLAPPKPSQPVPDTVPDEQSQDPATVSDTSAVTEDAAKSDEAEAATATTKATSATQTAAVYNPTNADSTTLATAGALGQNGQANIDLWNAIAPCWNRIADGATLPATLKISFDATGALAVPPEIERDADASITDQSLKSEAQALQALSECGAYPMAQGQQNVVVRFPTPGQMPAGTASNSGQMAAVVR